MEKSTNLIVISPHLDDGVFSCGEALAFAQHATVITVFAGAPAHRSTLTAWDAACGFKPDDDVVSARRNEDRRAMNILGAVPIWLDFLDSQYAPSPPVGDVSAYLSAAIDTAWRRGERNAICFPLGLFHSDHQLVHCATLNVTEEFPDADWLFYEDLPYRNIGGLRDEAVAEIRSRGMYTMPYRFPVSAEIRRRKKEAVLCYQSQLDGLRQCNRSGYQGLFAEEHYLLLTQAAHRQAPSVGIQKMM